MVQFSLHRLADVWRAVQAGLARGPMDELTFKLLDESDGTAGKIPLATQRLDALEMWSLLGDPALRLPRLPSDITLETPSPVRAQQALVVKGTLPGPLAGAVVVVTLERPLSSRPADLEPMPAAAPGNDAARRRIALDHCQRANQYVLVSTNVTAEGVRFEATIRAPKLPWPEVVVRAFAQRDEEASQGVIVRPVGD